MKRSLALLFPLAVAACQDAPEPFTPTAQSELALAQSADAGIIPGRFIVTVRDGVSPAAVARDHVVARTTSTRTCSTASRGRCRTRRARDSWATPAWRGWSRTGSRGR